MRSRARDQKHSGAGPRNARNIVCSLLGRQAEQGQDPLEIVVSVILDFDPPSLVVVMENDVRGEVLLEAVLKMLHGGGQRRSAGAGGIGAGRLGGAILLEVAGHKFFRRAHGEALADDRVGEESLLIPGFQ